MSIIINYENIQTVEQALHVIEKLQNGLNNCYAATFNICPKCGQVYTQGFICWGCGYNFDEGE